MSSPSAFTRRKFLISSAAAASSAWLLAACGGGGDNDPGTTQASASQVPQADIDKALDTETTLTFWTWVPDITNQVKMFTTKYPKIKVNVVNVGQGAPHYQKLRTAIQSGQGAPDVAQMEYQYIPSFTLGEQGSLLDLTPYVPADIQSLYPEWVWGQVKVNNGLWGIPQDTGPMGLLYRDDLFSDAGIEAPATWDDFGAAAETYHSKNPKSWLVNVAQNQPGQIVAYLWQAGVRPFSFDGQETVKVDLANDQAKTVVKFFGDLVTNGLATSDADFNDSWYQGLASGKWASLPIAAWGPVFLQGTAGKTSGKWRANALPQWKAGENVSSNWGGSTDAVLKLEQEPDRRLPAGPVDQHRQGIHAPVRQRAVPVPAADVGPHRSRASPARSRSSTAVRRSTSCSPRSRRRSAPTSAGCRSWSTSTPTSTRRSARRSPTRPTPSPVCRPGRTAASSTPKTRASRSPDPWRAAGQPAARPTLPKGHPCPPPCPAPRRRHRARRAPRARASGSPRLGAGRSAPPTSSSCRSSSCS